MPADVAHEYPLVMGTVGNEAKNNVTAWFTAQTCGITLALFTHFGTHLENHSSSERWATLGQQATVLVFTPNKTPKKRTFALGDREAQERFEKLLATWREEMRGESNYSRLTRHPAYRQITAIGPQAVPLILKELAARSHLAWLQALEDIVGFNPIPVQHEEDGNLMIADWLSWGKENGIL